VSKAERVRRVRSLPESSAGPVSSRLSLLCELVTSGVIGVTGLGPQPTLTVRRKRRKRRIDPIDLIADPRPPYATDYFAAPSEIVRR